MDERRFPRDHECLATQTEWTRARIMNTATLKPWSKQDTRRWTLKQDHWAEITSLRLVAVGEVDWKRIWPVLINAVNHEISQPTVNQHTTGIWTEALLCSTLRLKDADLGSVAWQGIWVRRSLSLVCFAAEWLWRCGWMTTLQSPLTITPAELCSEFAFPFIFSTHLFYTCPFLLYCLLKQCGSVRRFSHAGCTNLKPIVGPRTMEKLFSHKNPSRKLLSWNEPHHHCCCSGFYY